MPLERDERTWRRLANRRSVYLIASLVLSGIMLAASPLFIELLLDTNLRPSGLIVLIGLLAIIGGSFLLIRRTGRMMKVIESSIVERGGERPSDPLLARLLRDPKLGFVLVNGGIIAVLAGLVLLSTMGFDGARNPIELFLFLHIGGWSATVLGVYILMTRRKKK